MELALFVYFANLVGDAKQLLPFLLIHIPALYCLTCVFCDKFLRAPKWVFKTYAAALVVCLLLPSERTLYTMTGAYVGQSIVESSLGGKLKTVIEMKLDELVKGEK